ncbi:MAG: lytic transglycosylase domain-containing protein [Parvularculaceae bacterium]|jgi:soluble lytic murein transglycosylase-like protein|nr:lytic transglycosylase domain-containing protein [Parvularculaceae bacterium]
MRTLAIALLALAAFVPATAARAEKVVHEQARLSVLSAKDRETYREILDLQEDGRWSDADARAASLSDDLLMGHVLLQRYMSPGYRATYDELKRWMAYYADLPGAEKIYSLANRKRPKGASATVRPAGRKWRAADRTFEFHPALAADYERTSAPLLRQIEGRIRTLCKKEMAGEALKELERRLSRREITQRQFDRMRSWVAASYYFQGYTDTAGDLAREVAARNGDVAVLAYWIAGLVSFRDGDPAAALDQFERQAKVAFQEDALRSAAGFWAARAALAAGQTDRVTPNLEIAAGFPFTFYGQLALSQLGRDYPYNWSAPPVTPSAFAALAAKAPGVKRAVALTEVGEDLEADLELRWAHGLIDDQQAADLLGVAVALELPAAQLDIALANEGPAFEPGLFPIPAYEPAGGFKADRAVLYALMRQESKFKVEATSRVGARGLMQLMPRTASFMAKDKSLIRGKGRNRLYDPAYNLELGQTYVNHLISTTSGGDLFDTALAYNGGPGNLSRWKRELDIDDPLLFIESIPNPESRDFVEKVLTNVWVYRARLGQPARERDLVAAGKLPLYEALDSLAGE